MLFAIWIFSALALALWSLAAFGLFRLLTLAPADLAEMGAQLSQWPPVLALERWLPGTLEFLRQMLDLLQATLSWTGDIALWVVVPLWLGGVLLAITGSALASWLTLLLQRAPQATPARASVPEAEDQRNDEKLDDGVARVNRQQDR